MAASTERTVPSVNSFTLPDTLTAVLLANPGACLTGASGLGHTDRAVERHRRRVVSRRPFPPIPVRSSVSRRMPRESLDALENLPKEAPGQVAFGQLEDEGPRMPDEAPAGLEQPLLQARE
jgi:hypothetical protein